MKTLVVRLDHLGDLLLTTPLVRALALSGHDVDVLVRDSLTEIFIASPYVQNCFGVEGVAPGFPENWIGLGRWMRRQKYDVVILAYAKDKRLCFASALSGARRRIAMWGGLWGRLTLHECLRSDILTDPQPFAQILLRSADALGVARQGLTPDLFLSTEERQSARARMPAVLHGRLVGIHPGSAGNACNLPAEAYGEIAALLLRTTDCALVVTGTEAERSLLARWPESVLESERVWISMGQLKVRELAAVIAEMSVYVCSSTGPLHLASAMATPTVSPFCPRPPLCAAIWGNTSATGSVVVEPAICPRRAHASVSCCDFQGQVSAKRIAEEVERILRVREKATNEN